jgi:hypothetical protein
MDRFHVVVGRTHELVVRGWRTRASCHMSLNNLRDVAQTVQERRRGTLGQNVRGEQLSASELCYDVDKGEGESP